MKIIYTNWNPKRLFLEACILCKINRLNKYLGIYIYIFIYIQFNVNNTRTDVLTTRTIARDCAFAMREPSFPLPQTETRPRHPHKNVMLSKAFYMTSRISLQVYPLKTTLFFFVR